MQMNETMRTSVDEDLFQSLSPAELKAVEGGYVEGRSAYDPVVPEDPLQKLVRGRIIW